MNITRTMVSALFLCALWLVPTSLVSAAVPKIMSGTVSVDWYQVTFPIMREVHDADGNPMLDENGEPIMYNKAPTPEALAKMRVAIFVYQNGVLKLSRDLGKVPASGKKIAYSIDLGEFSGKIEVKVCLTDEKGEKTNKDYECYCSSILAFSLPIYSVRLIKNFIVRNTCLVVVN
jgi:hypothetical protein